MSTILQILSSPQSYDHPVKNIQMLETHISWVFLTGDYAYKIKKPVNYGFLDFSDLQKRKKYCELELQYNRRLAEVLYLDVVAITQQGVSALQKVGIQPVLEYGVKMRQFDPSQQFDVLHEKGLLTTELMERLAKKIANFHLQGEAHRDDAAGLPQGVLQPCLENFEQIEVADDLPVLDQVKNWTLHTARELAPVFEARKRSGFIRACHGDMHLRNITLYNDDVVIFDCIEFNENFRIIDVISELAFIIMDLQDREEDLLAFHLLNCYLEITGDYPGLRVMDFYLVYRAMVRAKVDYLRSRQIEKGREQNQIELEFQSYLKLALRYTLPRNKVIYLTHGVSGSGKSYIAQHLADHLPAIRLRTDVERKRLGKLDDDAYSLQARNRVYHRLLKMAEEILDCGYPVLVDGTFLLREQRRPFLQFAEDKRIPLVILHCEAPIEVLKRRIEQRQKQSANVSDAGIEVLQSQLESQEPFESAEVAKTVSIKTQTITDFAELERAIRDKLHDGSYL